MTKDEIIEALKDGSQCDVCKHGEISTKMQPCSICMAWFQNKFELVEVTEC